MDWGNVWESVQKEASNAWETFKETGVPAIKAGLEQQATVWLEDQKKKTQAELDKGVAKVIEQPSGAFGQGVSSAIQNAVLKDQGPMLMIAGVGLIAVIFLIARK